MKNISFLLKWWRRFCGDDNLLWKRIVKFVHNLPNRFLLLSYLHEFAHGPFNEISNAIQNYTWLETVIKQSFNLHLGKGTHSRCWEDPWLDSIPLKDSFLRFFSISQQSFMTICDMGFLLDGMNWLWNFEWRRPLFQWETLLLDLLYSQLCNSYPKFTK